MVVDVVHRFFAPRFNINEDPVTGSAHCTLAPYWGERFGLASLVAYQASERGGVVGTQLCQNERGEARVKLFGEAVTVLTARLYH